MNKLFIVAALLAVFVAIASADLIALVKNDTVLTPFGLRPAACVNEVESGTRIVEVEGGYELHFPNGKGIERRMAKQECLEFNEKFVEERRARREAIKTGKPNNLPNGWLDNAAYTPSGLVQQLTGFYLTPNNPQSNTGQTLFYFLGTENFNDNKGVSILQPVLTYNNGHSGWNMASWNCCPQGETFTSGFIENIQPGQTMYGEIVGNSDGSWTIGSSQKDGTGAVVLTVDGFGRTFDWIDATLEQYNVVDCTGLPTAEMKYTDVFLKLQNGNWENANWQPNTPQACNGRTTVYNANTIGIQHN